LAFEEEIVILQINCCSEGPAALKKFDLTFIQEKMTDYGIQELSQALIKLKNLENMSFYLNQIDNISQTTIKSLSESFESITRLENLSVTLDIKKCGISNGFKAFQNIIPLNQFHLILFSSQESKDECFQDMIKGLGELRNHKKIDLSFHLNKSFNIIPELCQALKQLISLSELSAQFYWSRTDSELEVLSENELESVHNLFESLKFLKNFTFKFEKTKIDCEISKEKMKKFYLLRPLSSLSWMTLAPCRM